MNMDAINKLQVGILAKNVFKLALVLAMLLGANFAAQAALSIGTDVSIQGSKPASSTTPWVNSFFTDLGNNTVQLTITAPHLTGSEFIENLYLQFNSSKQVNSLVFTPVSFQGLSSKYSLTLNQNNLQAGTSGGDFSIMLGFQTSGGLSSEFNQGDTVVFNITTTQKNTSLSSLDFAFKSFNGKNMPPLYYEAAYLGGISPGNNTGWVAADTFTTSFVPEPTSGFAATACCFFGLFGVRRVKDVLRGSLA
jgi:hypothetical protein